MFNEDDLLNLTPYHPRQIKNNPTIQAAINLYNESIEIIRIGDNLSDELKIPIEYRNKVISITKFCTKPELEMLLIISAGLFSDYDKVKSKIKPKEYCKMHIIHNRKKYNNSIKFFRDYFGDRVDLLINDIKQYKHLKFKHRKGELY